MPQPDSDPGFTFVDRRRRAESAETPRQAAHEREPGAASPTRTPPVDALDAGESQLDEPRPDLASLCVMLYSEALVHLGLVPDPVSGQPHPDPARAAFTIDMLGVLKDKTEGNRTPEESALLEETLTTLRMGFVRLSRGA